MPVYGYTAHEIAGMLSDVERDGDGFRGRCPAHGGDDLNLGIKDSDDGRGVILTCFSHHCRIGDIEKALGLEDRRQKKASQKSVSYDYTDVNGNLLYQSVRYYKNGDKKFFQQSVDPANPGNFIKSMKGVTLVPYNLPAVTEAVQTGETVLIVEGEKDVETARQIGYVATCNVGGAGKWRASYSDVLNGAHVMVIPDNDDPGRKHAQQVLKSLKGKAASVKIVELPGVPEKGDLTDWVEAGGTREQLEAIITGGMDEPEKPALFNTLSTVKKSNTHAIGDALPWSDYTNAVALVADHGDDIRYCYPWKRFMVWSGDHWRNDDTGEIHRMAKNTVKRLARQVEHSDDPTTLLKHIKNSLKNSNLQAMIACAQSEEGVPVMPDDFDSDPWLLNCANGTLDLRTGEILPHNRDDLITHCLSTPYDPDALCPTWDAFLWRIMGGTVEPDSPDDSANKLEARMAADTRARELIHFLQNVIGYSLTGDTSEEAFFILYGSGQNGKSKFMGAIQDLLGTYSQSTHSKTFMVSDRSDSIPNDIARLRGARLVSSSELGKDRRLNEELVKRATGRDPMTARFLHAEFFDFLPQFKLFMATNYLPKIDSVDKSMWRRIHQIPFTVTIPDEEKDPYLGDKLRAELPGIFAWAVRGCLRWQEGGLKPPSAVREATEAYRSDMDVVGRFIDDRCILGKDYRVKASELYKAYLSWCNDNNERTETQTAFGRYLNSRGFEQYKSAGVWRIGIGILSTEMSKSSDSEQTVTPTVTNQIIL